MRSRGTRLLINRAGPLVTPKVKLPTFDKKYSDPATTELRIEVKADAPPGAYDLELK